MIRLIAVFAVGLLVGCSDNDNDAAPVPPPAPPPEPAPTSSFEVTAVNLTFGQPLSPLALIIHDETVRAFTVGEPASPELEVLAEAGDNADFLAAIEGLAESSGESPLGPGASETLTVEFEGEPASGTLLSVMTMLVNTNDAIAGVNGIDISGLAVGQSLEVTSVAYDAGTEANSEAPGTIPGPADSGEGFNAARDDVADQVTMHGGVVTGDDGLSTSVLDGTHRFDNPVALFTITRLE